jgi:transcriptional regulator with XRE-family HTH domain
MNSTANHPKTNDERPPFGHQLKDFRRIRGMSQLELAVAAGVSPRHVSFIESGRSSPSREMVLRLAETLNMPLRAQNNLLHLAGYAPVYPERRLDAPELAGVAHIIGQMLLQHEPFPAFVLDHHWNIVRGNDTAMRLFSSMVPDMPFNAVEMFLGPGVFREVVENWEEVAWVTLHRLRREVTFAGNDVELQALLARAEALMSEVGPPENIDTTSPTVMSRLRLGDQLVTTISTIASFNAARDVTLDELHVELIYPADATAEAFFRSFK